MHGELNKRVVAQLGSGDPPHRDLRHRADRGFDRAGAARSRLYGRDPWLGPGAGDAGPGPRYGRNRPGRCRRSGRTIHLFVRAGGGCDCARGAGVFDRGVAGAAGSGALAHAAGDGCRQRQGFPGAACSGALQRRRSGIVAAWAPDGGQRDQRRSQCRSCAVQGGDVAVYRCGLVKDSTLQNTRIWRSGCIGWSCLARAQWFSRRSGMTCLCASVSHLPQMVVLGLRVDAAAAVRAGVCRGRSGAARHWRTRAARDDAAGGRALTRCGETSR